MDRQKILVSGNAGFIGSFIVDELIKLGHEVYGVDDLSCGFKRNIHKDCIHTNLDLSDSIATENYIREIKPEIIVHCAAIAREGASAFQPLKVTATNYWAYMNLLEAGIKYKMKKIVTFSSMAVYGEQEPPFSEDIECKPVDVYGVNKAAMEHSTRILSQVHDFDYTIIRPHNAIGARQSIRDRFRNAAGIWMNEIMRNEALTIFGDGNQTRSFSPIQNSLPCFIKCLDSETNGEIYNIGGTIPITINELAKIVIGCFPEYKVKIEHLPDRPLEVKHAYSTYEKSVDRLGYQETVSIENCIKEMARWAKNEIGPQEWSMDYLPLANEKMPKNWRLNG